MDFVCLGNSGLKVSRLSLGCMSYGSSTARPWILDEEVALPFYQQAIEAGINFFDTADLYCQGMSEEVTGRALKKLGVRREHVVIATKVFYPTGTSPNERGTSKKHLRHAIDASLRRLGLDYVDLYQIHRYDPSTSMEETLEALTDLIKRGKALYLGASSMAAWEFAKFVSVAKTNGYPRFISMQNHYNLVYREEDGDDPTLLGRKDRHYSLESTSSRFPGRQPAPFKRRRNCARKNGRLGSTVILPREPVSGCRSCHRSGREARR
jgi:1-deoxyxylulose-5-phosphate synthase